MKSRDLCLYLRCILDNGKRLQTNTRYVVVGGTREFQPQQITTNHAHSDLAIPKYIFNKWILVQSSKSHQKVRSLPRLNENTSIHFKSQQKYELNKEIRMLDNINDVSRCCHFLLMMATLLERERRSRAF